jgi:glycine/D-amino acid oxidase-like deaminating enzyme
LSTSRANERTTRAPSPWFEWDAGPSVPVSSFRASAEVVVVGAGVIGTSVSYWLARRGLDVLLLDSRWPAWGASGRNAGFMLAGFSPLEDMGILHAILGEEEIDARYEHTGHLALAASAEVAERIRIEVANRPAHAPPLQLLGRAECEEVLGHAIAPTYLVGRWLPSAGALHPVRFVRGLAAAAVRRGVSLLAGTKALGVSVRRGGVAVQTSLGALQAKQVVLACGAWTGLLLPGLLSMFKPSRGQMLATVPVGDAFGAGVAVDWGTVYCRQLRSGQILVGGLRGLDPTSERTTTHGLNSWIQSGLAEFLADAFPGLGRPAVHRRWSGIMDDTYDGRPLLGPLPGQEGVWVAAGFGGHGLPPALGAGRALAEALGAGSVPDQLAHMDPGRAIAKDAA